MHTSKRAKQLRSKMSPPELALWQHLRNGNFQGIKFRRQYPIGPYIADFFCHSANLIIEVDGQIHNQQWEHDRDRDKYMESEGYRIVRFQAKDVLANIQLVLEQIDSLID